MSNKVKQQKTSNWLRPWNLEKFDNLYNRDERFFAILMKGAMSWLTSNIVLYNKPITHFVFNTGSSYLYVESNGYQFSMKETSGEDYMYMKMPRCVMELGDINIPMEELSAPYVRGQYERMEGNEIKGYNAQIRRLPIEMNISAKYVLSNFNESIILIEELINKVSFQQYFNVVYLGQIIQCSLEIDAAYQIEFNKIDMENPDTNQKNITIQYKLCSNYPCIDERTEIENKHIIESFKTGTFLFNEIVDNVTDYDEKHITTFDTPSSSSGSSSNGATELPTTPNGDSFTASNRNEKSEVDSIETESESLKKSHILAYMNDDLIKTTFDAIKKY